MLLISRWPKLVTWSSPGSMWRPHKGPNTEEQPGSLEPKVTAYRGRLAGESHTKSTPCPAFRGSRRRNLSNRSNVLLHIPVGRCGGQSFACLCHYVIDVTAESEKGNHKVVQLRLEPGKGHFAPRYQLTSCSQFCSQVKLMTCFNCSRLFSYLTCIKH